VGREWSGPMGLSVLVGTVRMSLTHTQNANFHTLSRPHFQRPTRTQTLTSKHPLTQKWHSKVTNQMHLVTF
jgi:hypothetical protein